MKVLGIGGAGDMGHVACAAAARDTAIEHVVVADLDGDRAAEVAEAIGAKASSMALDVTDGEALRAAIGEAGLVLNTVGPFYRFGPQVLQAAIDVGVHYADINDDWEPTIQMLEMSDAAAAAGITALIGMGASPGVTNILAAVAARELDEVDRLLTGWRAGAGIPKPTPEDPRPEAAAAIDHWIHNCSEPIRLWRDGKFGDYDPLEEFRISYPERGTGSVWTCGHPEPITLPHTYPGLDESMNIMVSRPGLIDAVRRVVARVQAKELDVHAASNQLILEPNRRGPAAGEPAPFPDMFALAEGTVGGAGKRVGVTTNAMPDGDMGVLTGVPLAIGAGMIVRGEITTSGVMAPEAEVDPDLFFERIAAISEKGLAPEDYVTVTTEDT
jgi:saccharopine dehydrogenase-like NADP-dependent oxidoreductase